MIREAGDLRIHLHEHRLWVAGDEVRLTHKEFDLLSRFIGRRGHVLTHRQVLDALWGDRSWSRAIACPAHQRASVIEPLDRLG